MARRRHFIFRSIVHEPQAAFLDGLVFLGFFQVNVSKLKHQYDFANDRLREEYTRIREHFPKSYRVALPNVSDTERNRIASNEVRKQPQIRDEMDDYWIFFHELGERVAERIPRNVGRMFVFSTVYHALVHGMYNAVTHGDPNADIELRVDISAEAVTLQMRNRVVSGDDSKKRRRQYHTRFGIRVGGAGKGLDTLSQLFDYAEFRIHERDMSDKAGGAKLILRHDLKLRPWFIRLKRAFLGRAVGTRDTRQLYYMFKAYI